MIEDETGQGSEDEEVGTDVLFEKDEWVGMLVADKGEDLDVAADLRGEDARRRAARPIERNEEIQQEENHSLRVQEVFGLSIQEIAQKQVLLWN